ncbi:Zinc finger, DHHC-type, palmitoyltransferase [Corchorus capsularis]|uniref:S-acyltransferase n=1 Tax=Corchorus capsularis TaxID=210143 RepID=A0A1R3HBU6_COCAP|nr:Zinc finger, DHHC-type, palmitoyltransferase [Corchorus capsularis]
MGTSLHYLRWTKDNVQSSIGAKEKMFHFPWNSLSRKFNINMIGGSALGLTNKSEPCIWDPMIQCILRYWKKNNFLFQLIHRRFKRGSYWKVGPVTVTEVHVTRRKDSSDTLFPPLTSSRDGAAKLTGPEEDLSMVEIDWSLYNFMYLRFARSVCSLIGSSLLLGLSNPYSSHSLRIMIKDPGFVAHESFCSDALDEGSVLRVQTQNESHLLQMRVRYCKSCKTYVQGFDHHCPAFGNCIGQKNYVLFMVLLVGFLTTETFYIVCSSQLAMKFPVMEGIRSGANPMYAIARSTLLFCLLQVLWQAPFLLWHFYCICFNIRTEEWVNWKKYPEFQLIATPIPGPSSVMF